MTTQLKTSMAKEISEGIIEAFCTIIPGTITTGEIEIHQDFLVQPEISVLIGITGDIESRLLVDAESKTFSGISNLMFGMALEGEMLESFVGEIGNMIGGNMCTVVSGKNISLDITHPTVLVGNTKLTGFKSVLVMPMTIETIGDVRVSLLLEDVITSI